MSNEVRLGDTVKSRVSGFIGVAVARHIYLQGGVRISVQPIVDSDDGKLPQQETFDSSELVVLQRNESLSDPRPLEARPGGPEKHADSPRSAGE